MKDECSAMSKPFSVYKPCLNGFPMTGACYGRFNLTPTCCSEDLCARLYPETGKPSDKSIQDARRLNEEL